MKYFIDTEFLEGTQKKLFGYTKPTIDLISIGIVCEDGREYYAISKDFNLKEAWNRYDLKERKDYANYPKKDIGNILYKKEYWIRDNVLKPIWKELVVKEFKVDFLAELENPFTYKGLKYLINKYGKTNKQIAEEVKEFVTGDSLSIEKTKYYNVQYDNIEFYGYYCDYDWVVFCWLFGKMIDLPKGFPMYCNDLKQTLETKKEELKQTITDFKAYPRQTNEHNALADSIFVKDLYYFLNTL